jgi:energy-coupling factor transporter ATP-binding protein EcfA2
MAQPIVDLTTEAAALGDILRWSEGLPGWQRDALRRLYSQARLNSVEIAELVAICKAKSPGVPILATHIRDAGAGQAVVSLSALHGLSHVNALAPGERLSFGKTGLTVIYGDNGAGKSGYARVLKQLCRARHPKGDDAVLPNIYAGGGGVPTASVDFLVGGQGRSATWSQGGVTDPLLSAVSVFDSRTANVHVESTNDLAYTPQPLRMLADLAQACQDVKATLTAEVQELENKTPAVLETPACQAETAVGELVTGLSGKTKPEDVERLAQLTEAETARLQTLTADLGADPARIVRQLQAQESRIRATLERLEQVEAAATETNLVALRAARGRLMTARAAAQAASTDLFRDEQLPDIGSETWRALWEAARAYSQASAYPEQPFPVTDSTSHCVLCQQSLDEPAARRLSSFEAFVQDESQRRETEADDAYHSLLDQLSEPRFSIRDIPGLKAFLRDDVGRGDVADALRRELLQWSWRLRALLRRHADAVPILLPEPPVAAGDRADVLTQIATRVRGLQAEAGSAENAALVAERDALADRQWLGLVKADVLAQIGRLKAIEALRTAIKETATTKITAQSTRIAQALVTDRLRGRFAAEVDKLGVAGLAIELQQAKTSAGVLFFQVRLINKPGEAVGKVLSEGEHRCVALAAFLAELSTTDAQSAIVFDDPVSSLDHLHRDRVAARLAEAGQSRQVIVFTHDMAFLLLLDEACRPTKDRAQTAITYRLISRGPDNAGYCHPEPPASVMPLDAVIAGMRAHLGNVKVHHTRGDQANWLREVTSFQDQLRTSWERAVEEFVGPVLRRLSRRVDTTGLAKLTVLTNADCDTMREAFGRCSMLLHSQPGEINPKLPEPSAIEAEIDSLARWLNDVRARQEKVK